MDKSKDGLGMPTVIPPAARELFEFGGLGVHWKIDGSEAGRRFSIDQHPIAPRAVPAPLHYHHKEDQYSNTLERRLGAVPGDEVVEAGPGTWVFEPRHQWHTFSNAGEAPGEIIEVISPAGFEDAFREWAAVGDDLERAKEVDRKSAIDMDYDRAGFAQRDRAE